MVISSTSAVEASIQAVSPELIFAPSMSSGFVGAGGAAGAAAAAGAGAAGVAAGAPRLSWALRGGHQPPGPSRGGNSKNLFILVLPYSASAPGSPVRLRVS